MCSPATIGESFAITADRDLSVTSREDFVPRVLTELNVNTSRQKRAKFLFMHPAVFISSWVLLGTLFALQEWMNLRRWGYHVGSAIIFESWGAEYLIFGFECWLMWRLLWQFIVKASVVEMATWVLPFSVAFGLLKEMIWVLVFPNLPLDRP